MKLFFSISYILSLVLVIKCNKCDPNPCQNNGICEKKFLSFECKCEKGYTGKLCEIKNPFYHCNHNLCQNNATCVSSLSDFECQCQDKFFGKYCEKTNSQTDCRSSECFNNGVCETSGDSFQCKCKSGFSGTFCQNKESPCVPSPCYNNGVCTVVSSDRYRCFCNYEYFGSRCEKYDYRRLRRALFFSFIYGLLIFAFITGLIILILWLTRTMREKKRQNEQRQNIATIFGRNFEMRNPDLDPPEKQPYNFNANPTRQNVTSYI